MQLTANLERDADRYGRALLAGTAAVCAQPAKGLGNMLAVRYSMPAYDIEVPALSASRLSINLADSSVEGGILGEARKTYRARRFSLFLTPAAAPTLWHKHGPSSHINVYFDATSTGNEDSDGRGLGFWLREEVPVMNAQLRSHWPLLNELEREMNRVDEFTEEAVDSLTRLILLALARQFGREPDARDLLTRRQMDLVSSHVRANIARKIFVKDLAAAVGMSVSSFARAFVATAHLSPHQFVMRERVERALQLSLRTGTALCDVAFAAGFSSQAHMTRVLKERTGRTPGGWRLSGAKISDEQIRKICAASR